MVRATSRGDVLEGEMKIERERKKEKKIPFFSSFSLSNSHTHTQILFLCTSRELAPEKSEQTSSNNMGSNIHYVLCKAQTQWWRKPLNHIQKRACDFDHSPQKMWEDQKWRKKRKEKEVEQEKRKFPSYSPLPLLFSSSKDVSTLHNLQRDGSRKQSCKRQQTDIYS